MANYGRPHSNNSQFVITTVESTHLDGSNVVFGRVLCGFGVVAEMEKFTDDDAVPFAVSCAGPPPVYSIYAIMNLSFRPFCSAVRNAESPIAGNWRRTSRGITGTMT